MLKRSIELVLVNVLTGGEYQSVVTLLVSTGAEVSHPTCRVLLLHHTGRIVVVIQHNAVQRLGRVVTERFNGEACLILPPKTRTDRGAEME